MFTFDQNGPDFFGTFTSLLNGLIQTSLTILGFIHHNGGLQVDSSLLNVVLRG